MAGNPITQNELTPRKYAASTVTRVEEAPIQDADRERKTSIEPRSRDARKKSSRLLVFLAKNTPTIKSRRKYPARATSRSIRTQALYQIPDSLCNSSRAGGMCYNHDTMWIMLILLLSWPEEAPQTAEDIARNLEARMGGLHSLQADFQQTYFSSTISTPLQEKGKLYMRKPGWLRFDYEDPEIKVFLIKDNLYQEYWPEDKQLVERTLTEEGSEGALLALLAGASGILEHYRVEFDPDAPENSGSHHLKLTPREEEADTYILLEIDARDWLIRRAVSFDWTGNRQEFLFSRVKTGIRLSDSLFELKVPPDVDIIR
jgi:outer membrane lipoprotein-sorting protein